jgi:biotin-dependent carboxylase-like uncharacterized protein
MPALLSIVSAGPCCTIQDAGRRGHLRNGVSTSGPMDWVSFEVARQLAGCPETGVAIEVSVGGLELEIQETPVDLGLAGRGFELSLNGVEMGYPARIHADVGSRLKVKTGRSGAWFYVAPSAPIALAPFLSSLSTHARYGIGPWPRGLLRAGDLIGLDERYAPPSDALTEEFPYLTNDAPIRVLLGPQDELFDDHEIDEFFASDYELTLRNDRMAYVLEGPRIHPKITQDLITDGTALGSVQIAGDGSPYVLMADRSGCGGYPKVATIIRADIGRFAQKRTGERIRFERTDTESAVKALRRLRADIGSLGKLRGSGDPVLELLSEGRAISGVHNAFDEFD